jgi:tetratricopeptide (TPR) repeat protein
MSIQRLLKSFRSTWANERDEVTLDEETALYRLRAEVAMREERFHDALVFLAKILRLDPYDLNARLEVAETYHHALNEPTKALLTYEKVIAAANYDESNTCCVKARQGIRELTTVFETATLPLQSLVDDEIPQEDNGGLAKSAAG